MAYGALLTLLPVAALAQTEPMLPVPALPVAPNIPIAPNVPLQQGATVVDRPRPEVDALGLRTGPFFFFPRAEIDEAYNDNIFATNGGTSSDWITALVPSFDLKSNFPTNALNLSAGAVISKYAQHTNFDTQDAFGNATGRLDVDNIHDFRGGLNIRRGHEDPGSPNVVANASEPVQYTTYGATAGFEQTKLRVNYSADLAATRSEYEAVTTNSGALQPQSDRNNNAYQATLQGSYEFVPNYRGFVRGSYNIREYDHAALGAPIRDSHGFRTDVGARIDLTALVYAEFYVGYLEQDYRASSLGTVSGLDAGANVVWNPTTLTSVTLTGSRSVQDAAAAVVGNTNAPGYLHSTAGVRVDHELLRNLLINIDGSYANDDFQGINRTDGDYLAGVGAKYLLNRHLYLGATYTYEHRDSTGAQAINAFSRNIMMVRLSTQY